MESVSYFTASLILSALLYFTVPNQALAAIVEHEAGMGQHDQQRSRYARSATARGPQTIQRLPSDLKPWHYDLEIEPDIYQTDHSDFTFRGVVKIHVTCVSPTDQIVLHAKQLTIARENIVVQGSSGTVGVSSTTTNVPVDIFTISLETQLTQGENYTVEIAFSGILKNDLRGLYYFSHRSGEETLYGATTQFQIPNARKAFPCMDEPAFKATFTITVIRQSTHIALSNMPLRISTNRDDDKVADEFKKSVAMSTYLVAFSVLTGFSKKTKRTSNNVMVEMWSRNEILSNMDYALDFTVRAVEYCETLFGVQYPLTKLSSVAVPQFLSLGMENWGHISYREDIMNVPTETGTDVDKSRAAVLVGHEVAHMWFGNLVSPKWWDDLWLNEGFAVYVKDLVIDHIHPEWKWMDIQINTLRRAMEADGVVSSHPLHVPITLVSQYRTSADTIVYQKGAFIIHMLRFVIGPDVFTSGLQRYLNELKFKNAESADLWTAISESLPSNFGVDFVDVMKTWVEQMNFPIVTVSTVDQTMTLTQERFPPSATTTDSDRYKWNIPFTYTTRDNPNFDISGSDVVWFNKKETQKTITVSTLTRRSWVLGNIGVNGYYLVNYDDSNWKRLVNQLRRRHKVIGYKNRAQLIHDSWLLARAGQTNMMRALDAMRYIHKETEYYPMDLALRNLNYIRNMFYTSDISEPFKRFMKRKLSGLYGRLGMTPPEGETTSFTEKKMRDLVVKSACAYQLNACISDAQNYFDAWKTNPANNMIPADIRSVVYCAVLQEGNTEEFDFVYGRFVDETDITEKTRLRNALSCTRNSEDLERLLEKAFTTNDIKSQDVATVFYEMRLNPIGPDTAWTFINRTWGDPTYFETYESHLGWYVFLFKDFGGRMNNVDTLQMIEEFGERHNNLGPTAGALDAAKQSMNNNIDWTKKYSSTVLEWLRVQDLVSTSS